MRLTTTTHFRSFQKPALYAAVIVAGLSLALLSAGSAFADPIIVTNDSDSGDGSLRQAVLDAQPGDTIIFSSSAFSNAATINLTSGQIEISKSLNIDGAQNPGVVTPTLSGSSAQRVFLTDANASVVLNRLNIVNGSCYQCDGGGIYVMAQGNLAARNTVFSGNSANVSGGAIANAGTAVIASSTFSGNSAPYGGAIRNWGLLNLDRAVINANTATYGGAIRNEGTNFPVTQTAILALSNSAVYGNSAAQSGGGLQNSYFASAALTNTTFYSNSAATYGGAIMSDDSSVAGIVNATLYGNRAALSGGAIYNGGAITLTNSIVAGSATGGNCAWQTRPPVDGGGNLDDANTCAFGSGVLAPSQTMANPLLGPLQVNAPGSIPTLALLPSSPALNGGSDAACPATDARGVMRVQALHCDIGAYEAFGHFVFVPGMRR